MSYWNYITRSIFLWTRWNSSVISCSEIESNLYFSIVAVTNKLFVFSLISVLGTHAIRFCIVDLFWVYLLQYILRHFISFVTNLPIPFLHLTSIDRSITWVCRMGFISNLKCIRLFSNLIGSQCLIDKHHHTSGIGRVVTCGKMILSSFLFISHKLSWQWNARTCQLPVYPGCNFTSDKILCIRLTHPYIGFLTLKSDFYQIGVLKCLSGWLGFLSWIGRLLIKSGEWGSMIKAKNKHSF